MFVVLSVTFSVGSRYGIEGVTPTPFPNPTPLNCKKIYTVGILWIQFCSNVPIDAQSLVQYLVDAFFLLSYFIWSWCCLFTLSLVLSATFSDVYRIWCTVYKPLPVFLFHLQNMLMSIVKQVICFSFNRPTHFQYNFFSPITTPFFKKITWICPDLGLFCSNFMNRKC